VRRVLHIGAFVAALLLVPAGILFYLLARKGFKSGKIPFEPDWKS
jgi:hypothetical protein